MSIFLVVSKKNNHNVQKLIKILSFLTALLEEADFSSYPLTGAARNNSQDAGGDARLFSVSQT